MTDQPPPPYVPPQPQTQPQTYPQPQPGPWASPGAPPQPNPWGSPGLPPQQMLQGPPRPFRPIRPLAILAIAGLGVWFLTNVAAVVVSAMRYLLIDQFLVDQESVPIADLDASDAAYQLTGILETAGLVVAGVLFIVWLFRARANAEAILGFQHRLARPWLVFGWIVPIVALWFPKNIVDDIWKTSDPASPNRNPKAAGGGPRIVLVWWLFYLLGTWASTAATNRLLLDDTIEGIQAAAGTEVLFAPVSWVAAVLAVVVILRLSKIQESQRPGVR